ncbi:unnamed protein product [Prorocentrum cordatum]|uniref:1-alkyl-2-acetylglycerophosphocholine esterase n=1 Tax=Prorocentrum cordatum TaxID=2364126 RepID=A0ABN9RWG5_9DINO|nr:unnamed protein product [Polarella glacialis]
MLKQSFPHKFYHLFVMHPRAKVAQAEGHLAVDSSSASSDDESSSEDVVETVAPRAASGGVGTAIQATIAIVVFAFVIAVGCRAGAAANLGKGPAAPAVPPPRGTAVEAVATTIPSNCSADPPTLPSAWDDGNCALGAAAQLWHLAPNGTALGGDLELCRGRLSCEARSSAWASPHLVYTPADFEGCLARGCRLVVFLPGTGGAPQMYSKLLEAAASAGNFVIGLSYLWHPIAVSQFNAWCQAAESADGCNQDVHHLMLFGNGTTPLAFSGQSNMLWDVMPRDAVNELLLGVLFSVTWGNRFVVARTGAVDWSNVIVSGHSQGAGHAAYLSYLTGANAVLFSGPQDCESCAAQWLPFMANSSATWRALFHMHEECGPDPVSPSSYCEPNLLMINLAAMGLNDSSASIWKGGPVPKNLSAVISTIAPKCSEGTPRAFHRSVATDSCAPTEQGIVALWIALFTGT